MPVIRITDATYTRLKAWAEPLEDRPDHVIRRILDAVEFCQGDGHTKQSPRSALSSENHASAMLRNQTGKETEAVPTEIPFTLPPDFFSYGPRQRGELARRIYWERNALDHAPLEGKFVQLPSGNWRHASYASKNKNGVWWFGANEAQTLERLREATLETFVFLCRHEDGTVSTVALSAERLQSIIDKLTVVSGQIKFNIRRDRPGSFYIVFDGGRGHETLN